MTESIGSVLVATDLQASSRTVVEYAGRLARAADVPLFLLNVIEPTSVEDASGQVRASLLEQRRAECARALQLQAEALEKAATRVETDQVVDRPAHEAILERVVDIGADIVVVGSGAREGRGHRLGSTADRLLRSSPVPCLIVRGRAGLPVTKAAAATDFSSHSRRSFRVAARWTELLGEGGIQLDLVHAVYRSFLELDPSHQGVLEKNLDREVERLGGSSDTVRLGARLCVGDHPVDTILELAEEESYQLLIAGTHGHGRVRRALIGSVAMGLAQSAPCPVLIVPPQASR